MGSVSGGSGSGCGAKNTYGMAWEVAKYRDWYQEVATGANWCLEYEKGDHMSDKFGTIVELY